MCISLHLHTHKYIDNSRIEKPQSMLLHQILNSDKKFAVSHFLFLFYLPLKQCSAFQVTEQKKMICANSLGKNTFSVKLSICMIFSTIYKNPFKTFVDQHHSLLEKKHYSVNFTIDQSFQSANCDNWIFYNSPHLRSLSFWLISTCQIFIEVFWIGIN